MDAVVQTERLMVRPRILIVDDERNASSALSEILCDAGYDVAVATTGEEGLALLDSFRPNVLLTDVFMHGMNGLELAKVARRKLDALQVVFMSGYAPKDRGKAPWLSKPLRLDELLTTLQRVLLPT